MRSGASRADDAMVVRTANRTQAMPKLTRKETSDGEEKSEEGESQEEVVGVIPGAGHHPAPVIRFLVPQHPVSLSLFLPRPASAVPRCGSGMPPRAGSCKNVN